VTTKPKKIISNFILSILFPNFHSFLPISWAKIALHACYMKFGLRIALHYQDNDKMMIKFIFCGHNNFVVINFFLSIDDFFCKIHYISFYFINIFLRSWFARQMPTKV
jgi:hypothetical protein